MLKELLAKLKAAGKKVDGLSEDALATVGALLEEIITPIQAKLTETETALKAAVTKNTELETKVGELAKAAPAADPKDKPAKKDEPAAEEPAWAKELREENKKLRERLDGRETRETVSKVVSDTINTKFANHRMKSALIEEATERGYTKPEDVVAFVERRNKQLVDSGLLKPEQLVAEPKTEGAKDAPKSAEDEKAQEDKRREAVKAVKPPSAF